MCSFSSLQAYLLSGRERRSKLTLAWTIYNIRCTEHRLRLVIYPIDSYQLRTKFRFGRFRTPTAVLLLRARARYDDDDDDDDDEVL
jgi:hypothetical protein